LREACITYIGDERKDVKRGRAHMSRVNQHVTLSDGRKLGYNVYGPADGKPLFYFHGTPSSRIEWQMFGGEQLATQLHLRVISMDRPGMGLSDFQAGRRLGNWPKD
jgi:pimeloyl-ACP methyl ester carboxylesterase